MRKKVEKAAGELAKRLIKWADVDAVTLLMTEEDDPTSPNFYMSLDVYYKNTIPERRERQELFSDADFFESAVHTQKDRFIFRNIPIRIEYKNLERINSILASEDGQSWAFRDSGTYLFYRLQKGTVLVQKSNWLGHAREKLNKLPNSFWSRLQGACQHILEHYLLDLKTAALEDDPLYYQLAAANLTKSLCSLLFLINRRYEPSGRLLYNAIFDLEHIPEHFKARFDSFLAEEEELDRQRKQEIGELLVKSVIRMGEMVAPLS